MLFVGLGLGSPRVGVCSKRQGTIRVSRGKKKNRRVFYPYRRSMLIVMGGFSSAGKLQR